MADHARYATAADPSVGTWCRGKSSPTGRRRRLQPISAVASVRSGAEFGPCAKRARSKSDGGYDRVKHRMCGFNPSGLTSGLKVHASYLTSGLASYQASGLIQNHVLNHRRTTREAAAARARFVKSAGTTGRPNTGQRATNAHIRQPRKDETRSSNDATRKPGQSSSESCSEGPARAETPTATRTAANVWTAMASPAQRSVTRFERKTVGGGAHKGGGLTTPQCRRQTNARRLRHVNRLRRAASARIVPCRRNTDLHRTAANLGRTHYASFADLAQWTVGKRTPATHRSARRRMARAARQELADLARGDA